MLCPIRSTHRVAFPCLVNDISIHILVCLSITLIHFFSFFFLYVLSLTRWPIGAVPDFAIARSRVRLPPVTAVYQRQLSVPSLRGRLMSTSESWGVNGHTAWCTSPVSVVLQLRLVSGWGLQETEISAALWALEAWSREMTLLHFFMFCVCFIVKVVVIISCSG